MSSDSINIQISGNLNDDSESFEKLFQIYGRLKDIRGYKVYFEFSGCNFLQQNAVAFLGALVRLLQINDNIVHFDINTIMSQVRTNLEQNGFLHILGVGGQTWNGNSIPYREDRTFKSDDYEDYLSNKWLRFGWINISDRLKQYIANPVIEAYVNVFYHAKSPIGVITCGQHYPNKHLLKIALVDFGVGIPHTVRNYLQQPNMSASEALKWAFQPQNSTQNNAGVARGIGLDILKSFIEVNKGNLKIYSERGYMSIDTGKTHFVDKPTGFKGTLVQITLNCDARYYTLPDENPQDDIFF